MPKPELWPCVAAIVLIVGLGALVVMFLQALLVVR